MTLIKTRVNGEGPIVWLESNDDEVIHGVDAQGNYLGLVPKLSAIQVPGPAPEGPGWTWLIGAKKWTYTAPLNVAIANAQTDIDSSAGSARLRYMTAIPGQETTYMVKREQAISYIAAYALDILAPVPIFIEAEASATNSTAIVAANSVVTAANILYTILVNIERERRRWKFRLSNAITLLEVFNRRTLGLAAINAI